MVPLTFLVWNTSVGVNFSDLITREFHDPQVLMMESYFSAQIHHNSFLQVSVGCHLGCFQFQAIVDKATMNVVELVSLW